MFDLSFFDSYLVDNPELVSMIGGSEPKFYNLEVESTERCMKFMCEQVRYRVQLKSDQVLNFDQLLVQVKGLFNELHAEFIRKTHADDYVRVAIHCPGIKHSINLPFIRSKELSPVLMQNAFESVFQSFDKIQITESNSISVDLIIAHAIKGGASKKQATRSRQQVKSPNIPISSLFSTLQLYCLKTQSVFSINGKNNSCLLKAIVLGKLIADGERKNIWRTNNRLVKSMIVQLANKLGISLTEEAGIPECIRIEQEIADYRITIFDGLKSVAYQGPKKNKHIYILFQSHHFNLIKSVKRFFNKSYYCDDCQVAFQEIGDHKCKACCQICFRLKCVKLENIVCSYCKETCNNTVCQQIHQELVCKVTRKCHECQAFKSKTHVCGYSQKWCHNCSKAVEIHHRCFILTEDEKKTQDKQFNGFIVFDYEAFVENNRHKANHRRKDLQKLCRQ